MDSLVFFLVSWLLTPSDPLGLIFLYRFVDEDESEVHEDCPDSLWFANQVPPPCLFTPRHHDLTQPQTTSNACGTIAMLNIAMNCGRLRLGDYLARFKAATQAMHPALRGHLLSNDADLRSAHNAFARRLDMLMSDLTLKLEWLDSTKKRKKNKIKQTSSSRRKTRKKRDDRDDAAFHFIAYVPMGHDVWELNGMQEKPYRLGRCSCLLSPSIGFFRLLTTRKLQWRLDGHCARAHRHAHERLRAV